MEESEDNHDKRKELKEKAGGGSAGSSGSNVSETVPPTVFPKHATLIDVAGTPPPPTLPPDAEANKQWHSIWYNLTHSKPLMMIIGLVILSIVVGIIAIFFKDKIIPWLSDLSAYIASNGFPSALLFIFLIALTSFPPIIGYSLLLMLSGFIYGTGIGLVVNWFGGFIGGMGCFTLSRTLGQSYIRNFYGLDSKKKKPGDTQEATPAPKETSKEQSDYARLLHMLTIYLDEHRARSYKLLLLLRIAPYPYNIFNVLLAQIPSITYQQFAIVTGSTLSQLSDIFIINKLSDAAKAQSEGRGKLTGGQIAQIVILCVAILVAIAGAVYLMRVIKKAVRSMEEKTGITPTSIGRDEESRIS